MTGSPRLIKPLEPLGVEIFQVDEGSAVQEIILDVFHHSLDLSLRARAIETVGFGDDPIVPTKSANSGFHCPIPRRTCFMLS